jgi:diguanylate cyclase (GGDEF)-like protein
VTPHLALYISPLVVSSAVIIALLVVTWRSRSDPIAPWFAATLVAFLIWTLGYVFEILSPSLGAKLRWADFEFIGIAVLPVAWFEVVRRYTGHGPLSRWLAWLLGGFVAVSIAIFLANPAGIFRGAPRLDATTAPSVVVPDYGWYWAAVFMPVVYLLLGATVILLAHAMWRDRRSPYRRQYALLIVAILLPVVAGTLYIFGLEAAPGLNPTTAVISVSGAIMAYVLFHYRLFGVAPLARGMVVDGLSDGVIVLDAYDRIVYFNPAACHLFPGLDGEALGRPVAETLAFHPGLLESIGQAAAGDSTPGSVVAELSIALPAESPGDLPESRHFTLALSAVRTPAGRVLGHSVLLHDVTRSVELLRQVERLATTDPLTELLTRKAFLELGEREMTRARRQGFPMWLVKLDLDHFALVNDLHGSDIGDEVIRAVAGVCRRILRAFDLVGRFGGEEFVILLPHLSSQEAGEAAERLRQAVEALAVWKADQLVSVTASVGLAGTERADHELLIDLLAPADSALRRARANGGNRVVRAAREWDAAGPVEPRGDPAEGH